MDARLAPGSVVGTAGWSDRPSRMRVAQLTSSLSRSAGGLYYSVSGLTKAIAQLGVEVAVFGGADGHFEEDRPQWGDVPLRPHPLRGGYGFDRRVFGRLRAFRPDLLHVHGIWSASSVYGRSAQLLGIPVLVSPRGMLDAWIMQRRPRTKWVHGALFERPLIAGAHVHALSPAEYGSVSAYVPGAARRTFVLPNGTSAVPRTRGKARSGVLYLGRLHPKKQVLELVRAWARSPGLRETVLTIAGWGDAGYGAAVRAEAEAASNVRFVGALHGEAKARAFEDARAFVLPSLSEGMPMSVLEALQHGCLPLITDQCNLPELFADGAARRIAADLSDLDQVVSGAVGLAEGEVAARSDYLSEYAGRYRWDGIAAAMVERYRWIIARHGSAA